MYKPPQNCNRVKSIKSKFENIENRKDQANSSAYSSKNHRQNNNSLSPIRQTEPLTENFRNSQPVTLHDRNCEHLGETQTNGHPSLSRQLSDPLKRNIKRTPAFRVDKNSEKVCGFQRNDPNQKTLFATKVKQFNSVKVCENKVEKRNKDSDIGMLINECAADIFAITNSNNSDLQNQKINCDVSDSLLKQNNSFLHSNSVLINVNGNVSNKNSSFHKTDIQGLKPVGNMSKRPLLLKSKSSHDFQYIRSKFNNESVPAFKTSPSSSSDNVNRSVAIIPRDVHRENWSKDMVEEINHNTPQCESSEPLLLKGVDLSLLYTEPIPKSLRNKNSSESSSSFTDSPLFRPKIENIYTKSTLQLTDSDKKEFLETLKKALKHDLPGGLSDSLKVALKKPLPGGPAPKKPPRTFQHGGDLGGDTVSEPSIQKNLSFLHIAKTTSEKKNGGKKSSKRSDPKYKLNRLEMALKNNKLKLRKQQKVEVSTTSGEDSDDSLLFRSKSCRNLPKVPVHFSDSKPAVSGSFSDSLLGDLNCFSTTFGCTNPAYERIKEPNSSFFVGKEKDPIYAEPIQRNSVDQGNGKNNRNSLYYMSTALILEGIGQSGGAAESGTSQLPDKLSKMDQKGNADSASLNGQLSAENSSLSSFNSDVDSNPSPVTDEPHVKIRSLIENFENKRRTLSETEKPNKENIQDGVHPSASQRDSNTRIDELKNSIRKTLDKSFNSDTVGAGTRDSDSEGKVAQMVVKFHTFQKSAPKYQQPKINTNTLFYCCLVIEKVHDCAQIKFKFPPKVDIPRDIEHLCFPESPDTPPLEGNSAAQTYSLLVTNETGDRTYGYCRRVLPEASAHCLPLAYCILSKYRAPRFYKKILLELESRHGMQDKWRDELISQFYSKPFPKPGGSITIDLSHIDGQRTRDKVQSYSNGLEDSLDLKSYIHVNKTGEYGSLINSKKTAIFVSEADTGENCLMPSYVAYEENVTKLVLTLHPDTRYEDADLKKLHKLPLDILLKIFSSLLLERKVILISSVISELSSCVDSLQSILYPFTWYHTFIPILPESLWDIVESPTPVVCGVLSEDAIEDRHIENGIVVNLDTKSVLVEEGDEMKILSGSMRKLWGQFITLANNTKAREYVYSVYLADAYLCVFICCLKNYKQYVVDGQFLKDELVANAKTKGIKRFLKMFTETCMFHAFMDAALNNPEGLALFDKKIELYGSDESRIILDKLIDWHR